MIGTTDERFNDRPEEARSTDAEVSYLLSLTNELFPQVGLTAADIHATCAGIRPLPHSGTSRTAAISRGHSVDERSIGGVPVLTLIGGKLTTCRAFGEEVADRVLKHLGQSRTVSTRERVIFGGENYPVGRAVLERVIESMAASMGYAVESCRAMWRLAGSRVAISRGREVGGERPFVEQKATDEELVSGTLLPREFVREIIQHEWVTTLEDLVERRLLLALEPTLTRETLKDLAGMLCEVKGVKENVELMVERTTQRLRTYYGRRDV